MYAALIRENILAAAGLYVCITRFQVVALHPLIPPEIPFSVYLHVIIVSRLALIPVILVVISGAAGLPSIDLDGDGATLPSEIDADTNPLSSDTDGDEIDDGKEMYIGTEPLVMDTDSDGLTDGEEVNEQWTDPLTPDTDSDSLYDSVEVNQYESHPSDATTVDNGLRDGEQVNYGFSPTANPTIANINTSVGNIYTERPFTQERRPSDSDADNDGYVDRVEQRDNPLDPDKKDVVLEVEYMNGTAPNVASLLLLQETYNDSPVDYGKGINLHYHIAGETRRVENLSAQNFFGEWYPEQTSDTGTIYVLYADSLRSDDRAVGGYASTEEPAFAVDSGGQRSQTRTTAHELGHSLGITFYNGVDSKEVPYEQYPSVMNYNSAQPCFEQNRTVCRNYASLDGRSDWNIIEASIENGSATPVGDYGTNYNQNN